MAVNARVEKAVPGRGLRKLVPKGIEERWTHVRGHRVRYLYGGAGPPLLLIHGLMGYSFSWSENLSELSRHFTVYAPDMLNIGYSERCEVEASLRGSAEQVFGFMDTVGIERAAVIGTSHGGGVAMEMARVHPERVERLLLVAAANPWSERKRWQIDFFMGPVGKHCAWLVAWLPRWGYRYVIERRMYFDRRRMLPGTVEGYWKANRSWATARHLLRVVGSWIKDYAALEPELPVVARKVPTTLLWGDQDRIVPLWSAKRLQEALGCELIVFAECGHLPYEEMPEQFTQAVVDWGRNPNRG